MKEKNKTPKFSVFIPTFNRAFIVDRAIKSVLAQEYEDFELLVVDDCSTDKTQEILAAYDDPRIRAFRHSINRGIQSGYLTAVDNMNGQWLVPLGSDDYLAPSALRVLAKHIAALSEELRFVRYGAADLGEDGHPIKINAGFSAGINPWGTQPTGDTGKCLHSSLIKSVRPIAGLNGHEGVWNWWLNKESQVYYVDEPLYFAVRIHKGERLSGVSDNGTDYMSASDQRVLAVKSADPEYYLMHYKKGANLLHGFVIQCEQLGGREQAAFIRQYAKELGIPVPSRSAHLASNFVDHTKRLVVRVSRWLRLKSPAPEAELKAGRQI